MRFLIIACLCFLPILAKDNSVGNRTISQDSSGADASKQEAIDNIIKNIKEENRSKIKGIARNPFKKETKKKEPSSVKKTHVKRKPKKRKPIFVLQSIFNKKALIDNKWYRVNDKVYGRTLVKLNEDNVILVRKGKKNLVLKLQPKPQNDKFQIGISE